MGSKESKSSKIKDLLAAPEPAVPNVNIDTERFQQGPIGPSMKVQVRSKLLARNDTFPRSKGPCLEIYQNIFIGRYE